MNVRRGDVILVDFPFASGHGNKVRPAVVVQNDAYNARLRNTVIAMITSRLQRATTEPTQMLIDLSLPGGAQTGLLMNSAVNCCNLFTLEQSKILRSLGLFSPDLILSLDKCLKAALELK